MAAHRALTHSHHPGTRQLLAIVMGVALVAGTACGKSSTSPSCQIITGVTTTTFPASGGSASISVATASNCTWTATSNQPFLTVTSGASGSGDGTVTFAVAANPGAQRIATLTITGPSILITQQAATP
jgi:hypothetical protein